MPSKYSDFDEREQAIEAKFAHDEELRFRAAARRDKLFARWAAERAGLDEAATGAVVAAALALKAGPTHHQALLDLAAATLGGTPDPAALLATLDACARSAWEQIHGEKLDPDAKLVLPG
jgi:hypothetical protein